MRPVNLIALGFLALVGCNNVPTASAQTTRQPVAVPSNAVARIVFLDMENACHCTQTRIAGTWTALQTALAGRTIPIERIHSDTQEAAAQRFVAMRPMMVAPGIYFLTAQGTLREMLQGEVTTAQVQQVLQ